MATPSRRCGAQPRRPRSTSVAPGSVPIPAHRVPTALLVSRAPHCAADLLARAEAGSLPVDIRVVVGSAADLEPLARRWEVPFVLAEDEAAVVDAVDGSGADLVVLARYMRVLSAEVCERWAGRAINIHHSFLPAFVGADPYRRAHERGVKMIGATAHYVTAELDAGPIIAQDTARVSHRDTVEELRRRGAELERRVLADAVRLHVDDRVVDRRRPHRRLRPLKGSSRRRDFQDGRT